MSVKSRREVVERMRGKYERSGWGYRRKLIDELCDVCEYERKYAIKVLNGSRPGPMGMNHGGARKRYGEVEYEVVKKIWEVGDYPCGKRLKEMIGLWMEGYQKHYGVLEKPVRRNVRKMSAATLDRVLAGDRVRLRTKRGTTKPGRLLRTQIPVQCGVWKVDRPGYLEVDTVSHGGASTEGDYMHSITFTDIHTGWTELAAIWNKGAADVLKWTRQIESELPFPLIGFDSDNGSEFINHHLVNEFASRKQPVKFTRSRAYHKNDNAHVEQKNWTKVRQVLGYARYDNPEVLEPVLQLYRHALRLLQNFFQPVMKRKAGARGKRRDGAKVHKRYDRPKTPAQRVLLWKDLAEKDRAWIHQMQATLDPIELSLQVNRHLREIRNILSVRPSHARKKTA